MSVPIGMPTSMKCMFRPIQNMGAWSSTPAVTARTPRMKAKSPRRSERVLVLRIRFNDAMTCCESFRRAEQSWLRMNDHLHRHFIHHALEPALGNETIPETRFRKIID